MKFTIVPPSYSLFLTLQPLSICSLPLLCVCVVLSGRLELKIPWKNLYTQSVEATLDGVYLLIVPTASENLTVSPICMNPSCSVCVCARVFAFVNG